jgi:hypothetical protein
MNSKHLLPVVLDTQKYEPFLARYNLYVAAAIAFILVFLAGVTVDVYYGY